MDVKKEVDKIWEEKIKDNIINARELVINEYCEEIEKKLDNFKKELCQNIDDIFNLAEIKILKNKIKKKANTNLIYENHNNLINAVLLCLCNIESFVLFCLSSEKNDILKKINEFDHNSYFSLLVELMKNLWLKKDDINDEYNTYQIHNKLLTDNNQLNNCNNPGKVISFILSKLNSEFNWNTIINININNKLNRANKDEVLNNFKKLCQNNRNKITEEFFVDYQIKKKCRLYQAEKYFYEQRPLINLFIQEESQNTVIKKGNFKNLILKDNYNFLLNDNIDIPENCEICAEVHDFIINNSIQSYNNNILIINLDREGDPLLERNIIFPLNLELPYKENEKKNFVLISVLIKNYNEFGGDENYTVYCKKFFQNKWIAYSKDEIKSIQNEEEILNGERALLLIYKKND